MRMLKKLVITERRRDIAIPLFAVLFSLIASSILLIALGRNPLLGFQTLLEGAGILPKPRYAGGVGQITDFTRTLSALTPMIFASLSVTVAFKAGMFNIGVAGQMLFAGFVATLTVGYSTLPLALAMPLAILVGAASGAAVGLLIGWLKLKFNINEVVSSIMLNFILSYVTGYFILMPQNVDALTRNSRAIEPTARLVIQNVQIGGVRAELPIFILLAVAVTFLIKFYLNRTRAGFEMRATGSNPRAARYFGVATGKTMLTAMLFSGGLAGVAGVMHYMGLHNNIVPHALPATGFDAIAVSLLGNANPIGGLFASLLVTTISTGATYMGSRINVQSEIAQVIIGLILLFSACGAYLRYRLSKTGDVPVSEQAAETDKETK